MRPLVCLSHRLHARNWLASGMLDKMARAGLSGAVAMPTALAVHCKEMIPAGWDLLPMEPWWSTRPQAKVREALRLGMLVEGARRGGKNYQMKVRAKRRVLPAGQMLGWRALAALTDPLPFIRGIERALPAPREDFPRGCTHLILPTLIHEDEAQAGLVKAARKAGAPVWAIPASWDNLVTKGRFLDQPDRIAVWGPASARHATEHHGFKPGQVTITGPPHFWPYGVTARVPKLFLPHARHVVFAGTTVNYAADEEEVLVRLAEGLRSITATRDIAVLYRPHPRRRPDGLEVLKQRDIVIDPRWKGGWSLETADVPWIRSICDGALCVVSAFSTVVLEAALCGVPSILIGFGASAHGTGTALDHQKYEHMAEMLDKPGIWLASSMNALLGYIKAVAGPQRVPPDALRSWALQIAAVEPDPRENLIRWLKERA